jgi:hypothetical protein
VFWPRMLRLRFRRFASFWMTHFHTSADLNGPQLRSRPNMIAEGLCIVFSLRTSKQSRYQESFSWVAFKLKKNRPELRPLRQNFQPGSDP